MNDAAFRPSCRGGEFDLIELLCERAQRFGDRTAFTMLSDSDEPNQSITYRALDQGARAVASTLVKRADRGSRALLLYPPGIDFVVGLFGCLYAGMVAVPVYPPRRNRNMQRLESIMTDADATVALTVSGVSTKLDLVEDPKSGFRSLTWVVSDTLDPSDANAWRRPDVDPDELAILQYTSGSTGQPRGVMLTHGNVLSNCALIHAGFGTFADDVGLSWLPTYHDMGLIGGILSPIYSACPLYLMSPMAFLQRPARWLRAISDGRVSVSGAPNFAYDLCVKKISDGELVGVDLSSWRVAYNGAEPIRAGTLERFTERFSQYGFRREAFYACYGLAESTLMITGGARPLPPHVAHFEPDSIKDGIPQETSADDETGQPLVSSGTSPTGHGTTVMIVDPSSRRRLPDGKIGEIWVSSPSVGIGYFGKPELSRETFQARRVPSDKRDYLRTGDLGFMHDDQLFVTGRLKDLIILRGVNHYPHDIELTVERASSRLRLGAVAAFSVEVDEQDRLVIVCEVERSAQNHWDHVIMDIRQAVAREHELQPVAVVLIRAGSIPKTSSGKIQRHACRDGFEQRSLMVIAEWREESELTAVTTERTLVFHEPSAFSTADSSSDGQHFETDPHGVMATVLQTVRQVGGDRARQVDEHTNILELGLDSLERLEIANRLEQVFGGVFPEESLLAMETCGQVAQAVRDHLLRPRLAVAEISEIPTEYYRVEDFPEYRQLLRTMKALCSNADSQPYFRTYAGTARNTTMIDGREMILYSGYNYLGLSGHPAVNRAARQAITEYGTSVSASRLVSGQRQIHCELERELADFLQTEASLTFVGGHSTNVTTIDQLLGPHDLILHDALAHNSIIQGARLSGAQRRPFPHNDWAALDKILEQVRGQFRRVLIAIEGAYSMDGDFPDLPRFVELRNRYRTLLLVDEAHSLGTMGATGRGIGEHLGIDRRSVDIWMGTFSKALGSCGGYIAGSAALIEFLKYTASGFVYSVGMSPSATAATLESLRIVRNNTQLVRTCQARSRLFLELAKQYQLDTGTSQDTPVVPIIVGNSAMTLELSDRLLRRGIVAHPILHPAVEEAAARLRFFVTATHTKEQIQQSVRIVADELRSLRMAAGGGRTSGISAPSIDAATADPQTGAPRHAV